MKITGVIPARYQSSRFPGKPLAPICGKPMVWWVYQQASKVKGFDEIMVATDSSEIYDACIKYGMKVVMTSDSHPTGTDRLGEVASQTDADFYVNIQADEPIIEPEIIQAVIDYKLQHPGTEVINTMTALLEDEDVNDDSIVKAAAAENGDLLYLSRSPVPGSKKHEKVAYKRHLGLYGLTREALLFYASSKRGYLESIEDVEMLRFLENGYKIKILEVCSQSIGVDHEEDIVKVENVIKLKHGDKDET
jgi:3-deoxy-manno-octulosonate cytidylyltransferase (CMP-KDO synthetase)